MEKLKMCVHVISSSQNFLLVKLDVSKQAKRLGDETKHPSSPSIGVVSQQSNLL